MVTSNQINLTAEWSHKTNFVQMLLEFKSVHCNLWSEFRVQTRWHVVNILLLTAPSWLFHLARSIPCGGTGLLWTKLHELLIKKTNNVKLQVKTFGNYCSTISGTHTGQRYLTADRCVSWQNNINLFRLLHSFFRYGRWLCHLLDLILIWIYWITRLQELYYRINML